MSDIIELHEAIQANAQKLGKDKRLVGDLTQTLILIELRRISKLLQQQVQAFQVEVTDE